MCNVPASTEQTLHSSQMPESDEKSSVRLSGPAVGEGRWVRVRGSAVRVGGVVGGGEVGEAAGGAACCVWDIAVAIVDWEGWHETAARTAMARIVILRAIGSPILEASDGYGARILHQGQENAKGEVASASGVSEGG